MKMDGREITRNLPRAGSLLEPKHVAGGALLVSSRRVDVQDGLDGVGVSPTLDLSVAISEGKAAGSVVVGGGNIRPGSAGHSH